MFGPRRPAVQLPACARVRHHQLYVAEIPLACVLKMYVGVILLIPQHWITSWQFLFHGVFFSTTLSFCYIWVEKSCRFTGSKKKRLQMWFLFFIFVKKKPDWFLITACRLGWRRLRNLIYTWLVSRSSRGSFWTPTTKINWFASMTNDIQTLFWASGENVHWGPSQGS